MRASTVPPALIQGSNESSKRVHSDSPRDYGRADEDTVHLLKDAKELADSTLGMCTIISV